jgi:uncharacterized protein (TIGR03067 family)
MLATLFTLSLLVSAEDPRDKDLPEPARKDLEKFQGKWKAVKLAGKGMEITVPKDGPELILEFKGRKWVFTGVEKGEIFVIDPGTDPKRLDLRSAEKGRVGVVDEGIYKLDGDTLTICFYQGKPKPMSRPTSFDVPNDEDTVLAVFERVKAQAKEKPAAVPNDKR